MYSCLIELDRYSLYLQAIFRQIHSDKTVNTTSSGDVRMTLPLVRIVFNLMFVLQFFHFTKTAKSMESNATRERSTHQ